MSVLWYTYSDGVRLGPMSWDEVREAARNGSLKPGDHVWTAGFGSEWRKAATLETLFPPPGKEKAGTPPPPPGPDARDAAPEPAVADALRDCLFLPSAMTKRLEKLKQNEMIRDLIRWIPETEK